MISVRDFIKQERGNSNYDPPITVFQAEQLLIKYGRLVVDECSTSFKYEIVNDYDMERDDYFRSAALVHQSVLDIKNKIK